MIIETTNGASKAFRWIKRNNLRKFNLGNAPANNSQLQLQQTSPSQRPKSKRKRLRSVESASLKNILKKVKEIKKLVCISKLSQNNNCTEAEIKHGGTRYTVVISNQFFYCSSLQIANCKTCHHIVWVLLILMQVGEGNQLIAQVEIGHAALMQMLSKMPIEIHHHISTIDNEGRKYDQILM